MDRDKCFKRMVRQMHKYIKMKHNLLNLREMEEEPGPRSLQKVARWLGVVVVPAAPAPTTGWQLFGSARRWLLESWGILKNHYTTAQREALAQLEGIDSEMGERALEVAARWARRNLRNIQEGTVRGAMGEIRRWVGESLDRVGSHGSFTRAVGGGAVIQEQEGEPGAMEGGGRLMDAPLEPQEQVISCKG